MEKGKDMNLLEELIWKVQVTWPEERIIAGLELDDKYAVSTVTRKWNGRTERPAGGIEGFSIDKKIGEIKPYGFVLLCQDIANDANIRKVDVTAYLNKEDAEFVKKYC